MRSQKGITLIALVITIIVMLILVAVTITIAVNGGLFNYAQEASVKTNEAMANEQALGSGKSTVSGADWTGDSGVNQTINAIVDHYTTTATN